MRRRPSARLLILDPERRVLLFRFVHINDALAGQDYWATPGGGLEDGETFEQAAIRELREETGIEVSHVDPPIACREFELKLPSGERVLAVERFFVVAAVQTPLSRDGWSDHEHRIMTQHKWWSAAELLETTAVVWPQDLCDMLSKAPPQ